MTPAIPRPGLPPGLQRDPTWLDKMGGYAGRALEAVNPIPSEDKLAQQKAALDIQFAPSKLPPRDRKKEFARAIQPNMNLPQPMRAPAAGAAALNYGFGELTGQNQRDYERSYGIDMLTSMRPTAKNFPAFWKMMSEIYGELPEYMPDAAKQALAYLKARYPRFAGQAVVRSDPELPTAVTRVSPGVTSSVDVPYISAEQLGDTPHEIGSKILNVGRMTHGLEDLRQHSQAITGGSRGAYRGIGNLEDSPIYDMVIPSDAARKAAGTSTKGYLDFIHQLPELSAGGVDEYNIGEILRRTKNPLTP